MSWDMNLNKGFENLKDLDAPVTFPLLGQLV